MEDTIFMSCILFLLLETEPPFYVVIQAMPRSIHLQGKGSTFKALSIGLTTGTEPATSCLEVKQLSWSCRTLHDEFRFYLKILNTQKKLNSYMCTV